MHEKHRSVASPLNPQPRYMSWLGIELVTLCIARWYPTKWAIVVRAKPLNRIPSHSSPHSGLHNHAWLALIYLWPHLQLFSPVFSSSPISLPRRTLASEPWHALHFGLEGSLPRYLSIFTLPSSLLQGLSWHSHPLIVNLSGYLCHSFPLALFISPS